MRDKAHDELAVTVTTDPSETTTRALDHDPETAARVLLRSRLGRLTAPARGALPPPQPEQRLGGNEDTRAAHQSSQEVRSVPSLP